MITVFIDRLGKRLISILYYRTVDAPKLTRLYVIYVYKYYGLATTIVSNHGL
jgi:hypothetical protein